MIDNITTFAVIAWLSYCIFKLLRGKDYKELAYLLLFLIGFFVFYMVFSD